MRDLELVGIGQRPPQPAGQHRLDGDLLAERAAQQLGHAGDQRARHRPAWDRAAGGARRRAAAGSARPRVARRASRSRRARRQAIAVARGACERALQRFEIADDDGQQIVEVVRDAAGELADPLPSSAPGASCSCARSSAWAASRRSVTSRVILAKPSSSPSVSRIAIDDDAGPEARAVLAHAPALGLELALAHGRLERALRARRRHGPASV